MVAALDYAEFICIQRDARVVWTSGSIWTETWGFDKTQPCKITL